MEELDLKELLNIFWSRRIYILMIIAIFMVIGAIYSFGFVTPKYQTFTTVILAKSTTSEGETITTSDLTLNQKLVSSYTEFIKSKPVLSTVVENLKLKKSEAELKANVSVSTVKDTDFIKIGYIDEDAQTSKDIVSEIANVFIEKVAQDVYKIDNVRVWDKAELQTSPYNINHSKDIVIFGFIGVVVACLYALIANMLDTTVKSKEDIEKKIGLSVLTTIPLCEFNTSIKGGRK